MSPLRSLLFPARSSTLEKHWGCVGVCSRSCGSLPITGHFPNALKRPTPGNGGVLVPDSSEVENDPEIACCRQQVEGTYSTWNLSRAREPQHGPSRLAGKPLRLQEPARFAGAKFRMSPPATNRKLPTVQLKLNTCIVARRNGRISSMFPASDTTTPSTVNLTVRER